MAPGWCHGLRMLKKWWASLTESEARANAQKMFRIQQLPFDDDDRWSKNLEKEIMEAGNLVYHRPPNTAKNAKGCIEKLVTQIKVNQTKNLTEKGKGSHGYYITVKAPNGMGTSRTPRSKTGEWRDWMFHKAEAQPRKSRGGSHGLALIDRSRPHHIGEEFARFAAAQQQGPGNVAMAVQDIAVRPPALAVTPAPNAIATPMDAEGGDDSGKTTEIALQQALARINSLEESMKEASTQNVNMRGVIAQFQNKKRQEGLQGLKTGRPATGGAPASLGRKPSNGTKKKATTAAAPRAPTSGKTNKGGQAKKTKATKATMAVVATDLVDDITAQISFDTTTTATTETEFTVPGNCDEEGSEAESSEADSLDIASNSDEEDAPKVVKIEKGWLDKDTGVCMVKVIYEDDRGRPVVVPVASAVYDDDE